MMGRLAAERNVVRQLWPTLAVVIDGTLIFFQCYGISLAQDYLKNESTREEGCLFVSKRC